MAVVRNVTADREGWSLTGGGVEQGETLGEVRTRGQVTPAEALVPLGTALPDPGARAEYRIARAQ